MLLNRFLGLRMGSVILSRDRHGKHGGAVVRYLDCYFGEGHKTPSQHSTFKLAKA
jgi:hypothetical protein